MKYLYTCCILSLILLLSACGSTGKMTRNLQKQWKDTDSFQGLVVYDIVDKTEVININGNKYFTPASNIKLLTFYAAYKILGDSLAGLEYSEKPDTIWIKGTANPALGYGFNDDIIHDFFEKTTKPFNLVNHKIKDDPYGAGWAWDDYMYYYMPEKSIFPIYGNQFTYQVNQNELITNSKVLEKHLVKVDSLETRRALDRNEFYYQLGKDKTYNTPFKVDHDLVAKLLAEKFQKDIVLKDVEVELDWTPLLTTSRDSLIHKMMQVSDNFIAEQLMLMVAKATSGEYSVKKGIAYSLKNELPNFPQTPRWVDASGLSRYNLISPEDMVYVLHQLYETIPQEKLFTFFPHSNTFEFEKELPYVFAKTGSLSNNFNLSGYVSSKSGKIYLFSFMNNHFKRSSKLVKKDIKEFLYWLYQKG